ncbi:hypothetical protein QJS10_CPA05g01688 [Acorus calamus]|nr:hypothetical protein QJS10_CPA05g01688 [Acorus calamus]
MEMDRKDEQQGLMEEIHQQLQSAYCQFSLDTKSISIDTQELCEGEGSRSMEAGNSINNLCEGEESSVMEAGSNKNTQEGRRSKNPEVVVHPTLGVGLPISRLKQAVISLTMLSALHDRSQSK